MEYYDKYLKYKYKYQNEHIGGYSNISNLNKIRNYFSNKDICGKDDLYIENIDLLKNFDTSMGITKGYGGAKLFYGYVLDIIVVVKIFLFNNKLSNGLTKGINEIGITHYISDYFINNPKLTDNFVIFYVSKHCDKYLENKLSSIITPELKSENIYKSDINLMIVEKVSGDLKLFIINNFTNLLFPKQLLSILIQVCYTLLVFKKEFGIFYHGDLHCGNILFSHELLDYKTYVIEIDDNCKYKIKLDTYNMCPKLWDFETSYVKKLEYDNKNKYFEYAKDEQLITYSDNIGNINKDLHELLKSINNLLINNHSNDEIINFIKIANNSNITVERFLSSLIRLLNDNIDSEYEDNEYDFRYSYKI